MPKETIESLKQQLKWARRDKEAQSIRASRAEIERDEYKNFIRRNFNWFANLADENKVPKLSFLIIDFARILGAKI